MTLVVTVRLARVITEHMIGIKEKKHWACKTYVSIDIRRHRYRFHESCFGALDPALLHCYIETRWNGRTPETGWSFVDHLLIICAFQGFFSWSIAFNCTGLLGAPVIWQYSWRKLRGAVGQWLPTSRWPGALWPLGKMFLTDWDSADLQDAFFGDSMDLVFSKTCEQTWQSWRTNAVLPWWVLCWSVCLCIQSHSTSGHQTVTQQQFLPALYRYRGQGKAQNTGYLGIWVDNLPMQWSSEWYYIHESSDWDYRCCLRWNSTWT